MSFREDSLDEFHELFMAAQPKILAFPGCKSVELLCDLSNPCLRFTLSVWDSEQALENYRHSELFLVTWSKTKPLFNQKAMAWSLAACNLS